MDHVINKEAILIGSSMGGWISTLTALKRKKMVKGLILIAPAIDMTQNLMWQQFSIKEKKSLNVLCKGAALRYLLTRTYDYLNTPKNAIIKIKNPREYIQKLKVHNKFNNFKNYYN